VGFTGAAGEGQRLGDAANFTQFHTISHKWPRMFQPNSTQNAPAFGENGARGLPPLEAPGSRLQVRGQPRAPSAPRLLAVVCVAGAARAPRRLFPLSNLGQGF
jgi:hypothetical protein